MIASYINNYGSSEKIVIGEFEKPKIKNNEILVQVKAVSINPVDYKIKSGSIKFISGTKVPKILGGDLAGIISEIGSEITDFKVGEKVYGGVSFFFNQFGSFAEFAVVSPKRISRIPNGMTFEQAASLPIAALTAVTGVRKSGNVKGKNILVNGATGGVGHFAIQIAKAKGAIVTSTCSTKNIELAKQLGSDFIIDYTKEDLTKTNQKFDAIIDAFGQMSFKTANQLMNKKGVYSSTLFMGPVATFKSFSSKIFFNKTFTSANMRANPEDFKELETLFLENKLKPLIENIFPLEKVNEAFDFAENGKPRGKVVVTI